ncbi:MAG: hypothetical protein R3Y12_00905 [Clostridia bacterium]
MRVADRSVTRTYLSQLNGAKNDFMTTQAQIYSGNRFTKLSDDVSSGVRVLNVRSDLYKSQTYLSNVQEITDELSVAETALLSMQDILTNVHELALAALNEDKETNASVYATEISSLKDQLLLYANTQFGNTFTFGGSNTSHTEPFTLDENGYMLYNGIPVSDIQKADATDATTYDIEEGSYFYIDPTSGDLVDIPMSGDIYMDVGLGIKLSEGQVTGNSCILISFSGLDIFGFGTDEDGFSNNIYNILNDLETAVRDYDTSAMSDLDLKLTDLRDKFLINITDIGSKTKYLNTIETRTEANIDMYKITIDNLMGTNDEEAISTLAMNEYVLQAIMQMGSRVIPNTLMDFIR